MDFQNPIWVETSRIGSKMDAWEVTNRTIARKWTMLSRTGQFFTSKRTIENENWRRQSVLYRLSAPLRPPPSWTPRTVHFDPWSSVIDSTRHQNLLLAILCRWKESDEEMDTSSSHLSNGFLFSDTCMILFNDYFIMILALNFNLYDTKIQIEPWPSSRVLRVFRFWP